MSNDLETRVIEAENRLEAYFTRLTKVEDQNEWLEKQLKQKEERINELESQLDTIQGRTDLLDRVEDATARKPEERAAILIQTLYNKAEASDGRASLDVGGAVDALGGGVERTLMYGETGTFQKAVDLVDDENVLELKKEDRWAEKNTRLELDITDDNLPEKVAGVRVHGGASD